MSGIGGDTNPRGFLPLTMGAEDAPGNIKNSDLLYSTPARSAFPVLREFLRSVSADNHARAAFFRLEPYAEVASHIDDGEYYLTKDRYHLSLIGRYEYTVGDESIIVEPGTFFWFNNKIPNSAYNMLNEDRITFVFDLSHSKDNP